MKENLLETKKVIHLTEPSIKYKDSYIKALEEDDSDKDQALDIIKNDFGSFIENLKNESDKNKINKGRFPQYTYWIIDGKNEYCGSIRIRPEIPEDELDLYGHIGYRIAPSKRRLGYATQALELMLDLVKSKFRLKNVVLTVDKDNTSSQKVIEANGGLFVKTSDKKPDRLVYNIPLTEH